MKELTLTQIAEKLGLRRHVLENYVRCNPGLGTMIGHTRIYSPEEVRIITEAVENRRGAK